MGTGTPISNHEVFYIPKCPIDNKKIVGSSSDGLFTYSIDGSQVGFSSFWYNDWQPIHPKGIRSFCGSYTVVSKERIEEWHCSRAERKSCYLCKAIVLTAEDNFRKFNVQEIEFYTLIYMPHFVCPPDTEFSRL
jgi:hypothetical protein